MKLRTTQLATFAAAFAFTALISACSQPVPEKPDAPEPEEMRPEVLPDSEVPPDIAGVPNRTDVIDPAESRSRHEADALPASRTIGRSEALVSPARDYDSRDPLATIRRPDRPLDREHYAHFNDNPVKRVAEHPVSTFSIDVDTGSYSNIRRMLREGRLPPGDAVRVEEMINYFSYNYPVPESTGTPFSITVEQAGTPWNPDTRLLQIGIQGFRPAPAEMPAANLVFLIDVSGSMNSPDKLPLLKSALKMLVQELDAADRVAMVVYAGATGVVLESTPGNEQAKIVAALDRLSAGGRTNGAAGIELAYSQAAQGYIDRGINRVILATDGDFNVGMVDFEALRDLAGRKRETGVALTTLGFGTGNYNDRLMEQLADAGNGNHAYIDTLNEARKVLVDELTSTLMTIATDVKIQVEFNPAVVAEYRLVGYENRILDREDFNNDAVDAGDIGAGHTVTALYEIALAGSGGTRTDPLHYGDSPRTAAPPGESPELGYLRLRYKRPGGNTSTLIEQPIETRSADRPSPRLAFAAAVAAFGQHLRGGKYLEGYGLDDIHALASGSKGDDPFGYRGEFLQLVRLAEGFQVAGR